LTKLVGGGNAGNLDACSYTSPGEHPTSSLILELIPGPAEPSEFAAKRVCPQVIAKINSDPNTETSKPWPALGEESNIVTIFDDGGKTRFDEPETVYVATWRESGSCAQLIYTAEMGSLAPLSEFVALAESVSTSG
jgi:hypothetical protein